MKMIFVRHGETDWNVNKQIQGCTDTELNAHGLVQARELAEAISSQNLEIHHVYSSKLKRAYKTAEIIAECLQVPATGYDGLEEMNLGEWEGKTWADVPRIYPAEYAVWHQERRYTRIPGGESYQDLLNRLLPALEQIAVKCCEDKNVVIVTHSAVIMTLQAYLNQTPFYEMSKRYRVGNAEMVILEADKIVESIHRE